MSASLNLKYRFGRYAFVMRYLACERDKRVTLLRKYGVSRDAIDEWAWQIHTASLDVS